MHRPTTVMLTGHWTVLAALLFLSISTNDAGWAAGSHRGRLTATVHDTLDVMRGGRQPLHDGLYSIHFQHKNNSSSNDTITACNVVAVSRSDCGLVYPTTVSCGTDGDRRHHYQHYGCLTPYETLNFQVQVLTESGALHVTVFSISVHILPANPQVSLRLLEETAEQQLQTISLLFPSSFTDHCSYTVLDTLPSGIPSGPPSKSVSGPLDRPLPCGYSPVTPFVFNSTENLATVVVRTNCFTDNITSYRVIPLPPFPGSRLLRQLKESYLQVEELSELVIEPELLPVQELASQNQFLKFVFPVEATGGLYSIFSSNQGMLDVTVFSLSDLQNQRVVFRPNSSSLAAYVSTTTLFHYQVLEWSGLPIAEGILRISLSPVAGHAPSIRKNTGISVQSGGQGILTSQELDFYPPILCDNYTVTVATAPAMGILLSEEGKEKPLRVNSTFSVRQNNLKILYRHKQASCETDTALLSIQCDGLPDSELTALVLFRIASSPLSSLPTHCHLNIVTYAGMATPLYVHSNGLCRLSTDPLSIVVSQQQQSDRHWGQLVQWPPSCLVGSKEFPFPFVASHLVPSCVNANVSEGVHWNNVWYLSPDNAVSLQLILTDKNTGNSVSLQVTVLSLDKLGDIKVNQSLTSLNRLHPSVPYVQNNALLPLTSTDPVFITSNFLYVHSLGYLQKEIVYRVSAYPRSGLLCLLYNIICHHSVDSFTQEDIQAKRLYYKPHQNLSQSTNDSFQFQVFYLGKERLPGNHSFRFHAISRDSLLLPLKQFWVPANGQKPLTRKHLRHFQKYFQTNKLNFLVLRGPLHGVLHSPSPREFSWQDIRYRTVSYRHSGLPVYGDQITLRVSTSDQKSSITANLTIAIRTSPKRTLSLNAKSHRVHGVKMFTFSRADFEIYSSFSLEFIRFTVSSLPVYGLIQLYDTLTGVTRQLRTNATFTGADLINGRVTYQIFLDLVFFRETRDSFELEAEDPQEGSRNLKVPRSVTNPIFTIILEPLTGEGLKLNLSFISPKMITPSSATVLGTVFDSNDIFLTDSAFVPSEIVIGLSKYPRYGQILKNGYAVSEFNLAEVHARNISYVSSLYHFDTNVTSDEFDFSVHVKMGRASSSYVGSQRFVVEWCYFVITSTVNGTTTNVDETAPNIVFTVSHIGGAAITEGSVNFTTVERIGNQSATEGDCTSSSPPIPAGADYCSVNTRLRFDSGRTKHIVRVPILDDGVAEDLELFRVELTDPRTCLVPRGLHVNVFITDYEDFPLIKFSKNYNQAHNSISQNICPIQFSVPEDIGTINIPLARTGNLNQTNGVICYTENPNEDTQNDYVPRPNNSSSLIHFGVGQVHANCSVRIINDDINERLEYFYVVLGAVVRGHAFVDSSSSPVCVFIDHDESDEPFLFFEKSQIFVKERRDRVVFATFTVVRTGTDLTGETRLNCETLPEGKGNATAGQDYIADSLQEVVFTSGQRKANGSIVILPDRVKEGTEVFYIVMTAPYNGRRINLAELLEVVITDSIEDMVIGFTAARHVINETTLFAKLPLYRHGDLTVATNVTCVTRPLTADGMDFLSTFNEVVIFPINSSEQACSVVIINDENREGEESFIVAIVTSDPYVRIADDGQTIVVIDDWEDSPIVQFKDPVTYITEPLSNYHVDYKQIVLSLTRTRGLNVNASVLYSTVDTLSGTTSHAPSRGVVYFPVGVESQSITIQILADHDSHRNEKFRVRLSVDSSSDTRLGPLDSTLVIVQNIELRGVYFPDNPQIRSYINDGSINSTTSMANDNNTCYSDMPLVCITPCDLQLYSDNHFRSECSRQGIDVSSTLYTWWLSKDGENFNKVELDTLFTSTRSQVLEAVYLRANSWVRCTAVAVDESGVQGYSRSSDPVRLSETFSQCDCSDCSTEARFTSYESFQGSDKDLVQLEVIIPSIPNTIPILTSREPQYPILSLLTNPTARRIHPCSSLTSSGETLSFIHHAKGLPLLTRRHYASFLLYKQYQSLSCQWIFKLWLPLKVIVSTCSASNIIHNSRQLSMPLYISQVTIDNGTAILVNRSKHVVSLRRQSTTAPFSSNAILPFDYYPETPGNTTSIYFSPHIIEIVQPSHQLRIVGYTHSIQNGTVVMYLPEKPSSASFPVYTEVVNGTVVHGWIFDVHLNGSVQINVSFNLYLCRAVNDVLLTRTCVSYRFVMPLELTRNGSLRMSPRLNASVKHIDERELSSIHDVNLTGRRVLRLSLILDSSIHLRSEYLLLASNVMLCKYIHLSDCDRTNDTVAMMDTKNVQHQSERINPSHLVLYFTMDALSLSNNPWYVHARCKIESRLLRNVSFADAHAMLPSEMLHPPPHQTSYTPAVAEAVATSAKLPMYAFVLMLLIVVILTAVCSVTIVLLMYTVRRRWVLKKQSVENTDNKREDESFDVTNSASFYRQSVTRRRRRRSLRKYLAPYSTSPSLHSMSVRYHESSSPASSVSSEQQRPGLQRSKSLPNLSSQDLTFSPPNKNEPLPTPTRSPIQLISELQSLPKKERQNVLIATVKPLTSSTAISEATVATAIPSATAVAAAVNSTVDSKKTSTLDVNSLKRVLSHIQTSTTYKPQGVGWYERCQTRQKSLASYAQIYLPADVSESAEAPPSTCL